MRLFVALDIPTEAVDYIARVQQQLKQEVQAARWQPMHNLHLTLHFLGEVDDSLVPKLKEDIDMVSSIIEPFPLVVGHFGAFPTPDRPRVLWLGIEGFRRTLEQIHLLLGKRFELHQGVQYDERSYRPHITLARDPNVSAPLPLTEWNERLLPEPRPHWQVTGVRLYQSELRREGAVHTILYASHFTKRPSDTKFLQT